jgi:hypothetical protein
LVQPHSFKYKVRRVQNCVEVEVGACRWKGFLASFLWSVLWLLAGFKAFDSWWGKTAFGFLFLLFCVLFAGLGAVIAVHSVLWRTLILSSSGLCLRSSFFGVAVRRSIELSNVSDFGFGYASHSLRPVLRLELRAPSGRSEWIVLASGTTEEEVSAFLRDTESQGFTLPSRSTGD